MTGKVFFSVTMSLDGFTAPDDVPVKYVFSGMTEICRNSSDTLQ